MLVRVTTPRNVMPSLQRHRGRSATTGLTDAEDRAV
jgi:hypothetical protein